MPSIQEIIAYMSRKYVWQHEIYSHLVLHVCVRWIYVVPLGTFGIIRPYYGWRVTYKRNFIVEYIGS